MFFESLQEMTTPGRLHLEVVIGGPHVLLPGLYGAKAPGWDWEGEPERMLSAPNWHVKHGVYGGFSML